MQKSTALSILSLFTSAGTLVCCALPALLVSIGMGAVVAGLVSNIPQIVWLSEHKLIVFGLAGALLALAGVANYYAQSLSCPTDPAQAEACRNARKWSKWIYDFSLAIFLIGASFAFGPSLFA